MRPAAAIAVAPWVLQHSSADAGALQEIIPLPQKLLGSRMTTLSSARPGVNPWSRSGMLGVLESRPSISSEASGTSAVLLPKQTPLVIGLRNLHVRCLVRCVTGSQQQQQVVAYVAGHAARSWC